MNFNLIHRGTTKTQSDFSTKLADYPELNNDKILDNIGFNTFSTITQKMKFSIKDFFSYLRIWSHLMKKSLMKNFMFCAGHSLKPLGWTYFAKIANNF